MRLRKRRLSNEGSIDETSIIITMMIILKTMCINVMVKDNIGIRQSAGDYKTFQLLSWSCRYFIAHNNLEII